MVSNIPSINILNLTPQHLGEIRYVSDTAEEHMKVHGVTAREMIVSLLNGDLGEAYGGGHIPVETIAYFKEQVAAEGRIDCYYYFDGEDRMTANPLQIRCNIGRWTYIVMSAED